MNNKIFPILLTALILVVFGVAIVAYSIFRTKDSTDPARLINNSPAVMNTEKSETNESEDSAVKSYRYKYVANYDPNKEFVFTDETFDGKIYRIDPTTGAQTIVVKSVKQAYAPIRAAKNYGLVTLSTPADSQYLYFNMVAFETDGPTAGVIRFDGETNTISELKISAYYEHGPSEVSPKNPYAATIITPTDKSGRFLYLLDFDKDQAKLLLKLPVNQTFDICIFEGCMGGPSANIEWLNDNEFQIAIYNANFEKDQYGLAKNGLENELIEKRKFKIN